MSGRPQFIHRGDRDGSDVMPDDFEGNVAAPGVGRVGRKLSERIE
jgi:hypothetical protein